MWLTEGVINGGCFKSNKLNAVTVSLCSKPSDCQKPSKTERLSLFPSHCKPHICLDALNTG